MQDFASTDENKYANKQIGVTRGGGHHGRGPSVVTWRNGRGAAERQDPDGGQSLFEVVVAIAISALIIVALVSLVSSSIRNATFSRNKNQAASLAQGATEWLRTQRDSDIAIFMTNVAVPIWCFKNLSWVQSGACGSSDFVPGTSFIRQGNFSVSIVGGKTVVAADIMVSWIDSQGLHEVTSATNFTDWRQR